MTPQEEEVRAEMNKVDQGAPIPPIEISPVKRLWRAVEQLPPGTGNAVGSSTLTSQQFVAQFWRGNLVNALIGRGVLRDYVQDEESIDKVIAAAATFPCNKNDVGEAMILLHISQSPPEVVREAKEQMRGEGLDPDNPDIDGKFIRWMKDNC